MTNKPFSDRDKIVSEDDQSLEINNNILKINEYMYTNLSVFFKHAKDLQEGKTLFQERLKIMLNEVNFFILHCAVLIASIDPIPLVNIDLDEISVILTILEDIQRIFFQALSYHSARMIYFA